MWLSRFESFAEAEGIGDDFRQELACLNLEAQKLFGNDERSGRRYVMSGIHKFFKAYAYRRMPKWYVKWEIPMGGAQKWPGL